MRGITWTCVLVVWVAAGVGAGAGVEPVRGTRPVTLEDIETVEAYIRDHKEQLQGVIAEFAEKTVEELVGRINASIQEDPLSLLNLSIDEDDFTAQDTRKLPFLDINDIINNLTKKLIPSDPIELINSTSLNVELPDSDISVKLDLENLTLSGLNTLETNITKWTEGTNKTYNFHLQFYLNNLMVTTDYDIFASILGALDIMGTGPLLTRVNRLRITLDFAINVPFNAPVTIYGCNLDLSCRDFKLEIGGLFDDELLSSVLSLCLEDVINELVPPIVKQVLANSFVCGPLLTLPHVIWLGLLVVL